MKQSISTTSDRSFALSLPLSLIAVAGSLLVFGSVRAPGLQASRPATIDSDGDGLVDPQEKVLGTLQAQVDTDQDGWSDTEEFARQVSPLFALSHPTNPRLQVGLTAHGAEGTLHVLIGVYVPDQNLHDKEIHLGTMIEGRLAEIPLDQWLRSTMITVVAGAAPGSKIALLNVPLNPQVVHASRNLSLYVTVGVTGSGYVSAAASIHLKSVEGVPVLVMPDPTVLAMGSSSDGIAEVGSSSGDIYVPLTLTEDEDLPASWTPGEVCFQTTAPVSMSGAALTQEVTSAGCQGGFDGACPSSCSGSVGSTFTTIDPFALIGD